MELQIEQDDCFQRRERSDVRVGRPVMTVLVQAGPAGLLGAGPLSSATKGDRDGSARPSRPTLERNP